ncbi:hypothetical protein PCH_Pc12g09640 [Penicillium rubens Wisconsin 54-1255]|uniref:Uncharacterized protein n=1 Tax=Penicillium rubens (strain ATCC 28089 / DSM 1075 / NRRL 1951 / Wisconsin 54-1255) TaxID=500485 RepID=B6GZR3_PENRW|nr:hypothetical protein PCH_Pc12g09640 [Penicillium rubens Wisconsin 54-1255]
MANPKFLCVSNLSHVHSGLSASDKDECKEYEVVFSALEVHRCSVTVQKNILQVSSEKECISRERKGKREREKRTCAIVCRSIDRPPSPVLIIPGVSDSQVLWRLCTLSLTSSSLRPLNSLLLLFPSPKTPRPMNPHSDSVSECLARCCRFFVSIPLSPLR